MTDTLQVETPTRPLTPDGAGDALNTIQLAAQEEVKRQAPAMRRLTVAGRASEKSNVTRDRPGATPDGIYYPEIASGYKPVVGDRVMAIEQPGAGGMAILGRARRAGDKDLAQIDTEKFARDGSQPMTGSVPVARTLAGANRDVLSSQPTDGNRIALMHMPSNGMGFYNYGTAQWQVWWDQAGTINSPDFVTPTGKRLSGVAAGTDIDTDAIGTRQIAGDAIDPNALQTNAVTAPKLAAQAVDDAAIKTNAVTSGKINDLAITQGKIDTNAVTTSKIATEAVGANELNDVLNAPGNSTFGLRALNNTGGAAAPFSHTHSIDFKQLPQHERRNLLALENAIREQARRGPPDREEFDLLKQLVFEIFRLVADDPDLDRYERERMLDEGGARARQYKNHHRVDDWEYEVAVQAPSPGEMHGPPFRPDRQSPLGSVWPGHVTA